MSSDSIRGWRPVRVKKTRQIKNPEPRFDSIETEQAYARPACADFCMIMATTASSILPMAARR